MCLIRQNILVYFERLFFHLVCFPLKLLAARGFVLRIFDS